MKNLIVSRVIKSEMPLDYYTFHKAIYYKNIKINCCFVIAEH